MDKVTDLRKYKISQRPATDVEALLVDCADRDFTSILTLGKDAEGFWTISWANIENKVELIGMLEFIKMDLHESME